MTTWQTGDIVGPTNLNARGTSATTVGGFSTNTVNPESGATITIPTANALIVNSVQSGSGFFNVQAFGAVPTLAVDSTAAIQAAINSAKTAVGGLGGIVYVPPGKYAVSGLSLYRNVTLRGEVGGRDTNGTSPTQLYQGSAATTVLLLADTNGSGVLIQDITISASGNTNNQGGVLIAGMGFCELNRVVISGMSVFGIRIIGGQESNYNCLRDCQIANNSQGSCIEILSNSSASAMDAQLVTGCYITSNTPWISINSTGGGTAPDSPMFTNNRFISTSNISALVATMTNGRFIGNRFETVKAAGVMTIALTAPTGSQPAGYFAGNTYAAPGSVTFADSATTPAQRWSEVQTAAAVIDNLSGPGTANNPAYAFASERSLGFYKSASSNVALSYGTLILPGAVATGDGTALAPTHTFASEVSLGLTRSGASSLALSYGSLRLPLNSEFLIVGSGGPPAPFRMFESGGDYYITANRNKGFGQDNTGLSSWQLHMAGNAGAAESFDVVHIPPGGGASTKLSLDSIGDLTVGPGTAAIPSLGFIAETPLGWFRSGASSMALSYGTLNLNQAYLASVKTAASVSSAVLGANAIAIANPGVSGASICLNINGVMYFFNSSGTTIGR